MEAHRLRNIIFLLFFCSLFLAFLSRKADNVAEFLGQNVSDKIRLVISRVSSPFRFSIFELFVIISPLLIFLLIKYVQTRERFLKLTSVLSLIASIYVYTVFIPESCGARLSAYNVSATEIKLVSAAEILISDVNETSGSEPIPLSVTSKKIRESYKKISHGFGLKYQLLPPIKPLMTSRLTGYLGILALYAFPTSEICINTEIPQYLIPHTVAHEYAHFLGISFEGEANFISYVACMETEEPYIMYSASLSVLEYVLSDIAKTDRQMYTKLYNSLSASAKEDIESYREYAEKYADNPLFKYSEKINSSHQSALGGGVCYYSAVSRYVTAYLTFS